MRMVAGGRFTEVRAFELSCGTGEKQSTGRQCRFHGEVAFFGSEYPGIQSQKCIEAGSKDRVTCPDGAPR